MTAAAVNSLNLWPQGVADQPRNPATYVSARVLAANTAESISIPAGATIVRLAATVDAYHSFTTAASVPIDLDDGNSFELLKQQTEPDWFVIPPNATAISVVSAAIGTVTASFYRA